MRTCICAMPLLIVTSVTLHAEVSSACSTPVFRYALERWQPDNYEVVVLHRQPLTVAQNELLETLQRAVDNENSPANVTVRTIDLTQPLKERDQQLLDMTGPPEQSPWMLVQYPVFTQTDRLAFAGPFDNETVQVLLDSPTRRAVVNQIATGASVVWILIESGDSAKDDVAQQNLRQRLAHLEETLELPGPVDSGIDALFPSDESSPEPATSLSLQFTLVRVGRDVPEERGFVSMLINSEVDLYEFSEPIAIPIFGKGRSHYALVGKGINDDNIDASCQFLCGACSCEVKAQNPGADMLVRANWERLVTDVAVDDQPLPSLIGLGALAPATASTESESTVTVQDASLLPASVASTPVSGENTTATNTTTAMHSQSLYVTVIVMFMLGFLVVAVGTVLIKSRQKRS